MTHSVHFLPISSEAGSACLIGARSLRSWGIRCIVDGRDVPLKKRLGAASKARAMFCVVVGPSELERGVLSVKEMDSGATFDVEPRDLDSTILSELFTPDEVRALRLRREIEECNGRVRCTTKIREGRKEVGRDTYHS